MSTQAAVDGIPPLTLGWRLQMALDHADVSVQEMADQLGYSRASLSRWMHDDGEPRAIVVKEWAIRCGVPHEWLRHGTTPAGVSPDDGGDLQERTSPCNVVEVEFGRVEAEPTPLPQLEETAA